MRNVPSATFVGYCSTQIKPISTHFARSKRTPRTRIAQWSILTSFFAPLAACLVMSNRILTADSSFRSTSPYLLQSVSDSPSSARDCRTHKTGTRSTVALPGPLRTSCSPSSFVRPYLGSGGSISAARTKVSEDARGSSGRQRLKARTLKASRGHRRRSRLKCRSGKTGASGTRRARRGARGGRRSAVRGRSALVRVRIGGQELRSGLLRGSGEAVRAGGRGQGRGRGVRTFSATSGRRSAAQCTTTEAQLQLPVVPSSARSAPSGLTSSTSFSSAALSSRSTYKSKIVSSDLPTCARSKGGAP